MWFGDFLAAWWDHWGWLWMIVGLLGFVVIRVVTDD